MNTLRRYETLLPLRFNDGQPIPDSLVGETILELRHRFGTVSSETQVIQGLWENEGVVFRDQLLRVFVDVPDTQENRQFFMGFKEILKTRFRQLDIWVTSYAVDVI